PPPPPPCRPGAVEPSPRGDGHAHGLQSVSRRAGALLLAARDSQERPQLVLVGIGEPILEGRPRGSGRWGYAGLDRSHRGARAEPDADAVLRTEHFGPVSLPTGG